MADDGKEVFRLDLDTKDFTEKANRALEILEHMNDKDALAGLVSGLGQTAMAAGVVGTAFLAFKAVLSTMEEAENIRSINQQFELLGKNAGLATNQLKEGLIKSAGGLAGDTEIMKVANEAFVTLGSNAKRLPESMDLARKVTAVFGGELTDNFARLNQAIASGHTRALKQMGIIVDQKKAYEDYAKSIGVAAGALSESGKQAAMMNAVLAQGEKSFKGVDPNVRETTNAIKELKVTFGEAMEAFSLHFQALMKGPVGQGFTWLKEKFHDFKVYATAEFGEGGEQVKAQTERMAQNVTDLRNKLKGLTEGGDPGVFSRLWYGSKEDQAAKIRKDLEIAEAELNGLQAKKKQVEQDEKSSDANNKKAGGARDGAVDLEAQKKLKTQFEADLYKIKKDRLEQEQQLVNSLDGIEDVERAQKLQKEQQYSLAVKQIRDNDKLDQAQKLQLMAELEANHKNELKIQEHDLYEQRSKLWDQYQRKATSVNDGIARSFKVNALKNNKELKDFGKLGQDTFDTFSSHATDSLMALGEGSKSATDVMKGFFFGMLSDMAAKYGKYMLLSSIWPPNPAGAAAGAGLLVLAGLLKGAAGGKATSSSVDSGGASSGATSSSMTLPTVDTTTPDVTPQSTTAPLAAQASANEAPRRSVTIQIQGNYFETEQTKTKLLEMVRDATDATDFKYVQVGSR